MAAPTSRSSTGLAQRSAACRSGRARASSATRRASDPGAASSAAVASSRVKPSSAAASASSPSMSALNNSSRVSGFSGRLGGVHGAREVGCSEGGVWFPADFSGGIGAAELIGERGATSSDPRSHGSRRDSSTAGDLGVVEPDEIAEGDRGAMLRRQAAEGGVDVELIGDGVVEGRSVDRARSGSVSAGAGRRASAARFVERSVGRDPVAPRRELGAPVERVDAASDSRAALLATRRARRRGSRAPGGTPRGSFRRAAAAARRARRDHLGRPPRRARSSPSSAFTTAKR